MSIIGIAYRARLKEASNFQKQADLADLLSDPATRNALIGGGIGALSGGAAGLFGGGENALSNALMGALLGGGVGAAGGYGASHFLKGNKDIQSLLGPELTQTFTGEQPKPNAQGGWGGMLGKGLGLAGTAGAGILSTAYLARNPAQAMRLLKSFRHPVNNVKGFGKTLRSDTATGMNYLNDSRIRSWNDFRNSHGNNPLIKWLDPRRKGYDRLLTDPK